MAFTNDVIDKVWQKATVVPGNDPSVYRKDECRAWIRRDAHGDRQSPYGWEIDHIKAKAHGGTDEVSNLRPLHWENNASKQEHRLNCVVTSKGNQNVSTT